jgi:UDP-N-acetylmuramoylalanine-D-glutamate ligase
MWVNDSKATNVESTLVGLRAMVGRKVVLLLGGVAKVMKGEECRQPRDRHVFNFCIAFIHVGRISRLRAGI